MNRLTQELSHICRDCLLDEKWIIAPSLRVGHQWLDSIAFAGAPVVNVRVKTLKSVALDVAYPEMIANELSLISFAGSLVVIHSIVADLTKEPSGYLASLSPSPSLARTLLATVTAIRLAGLSPEDLRESCFEASEKAEDLSLVLGRYLQALNDRRLVDYADVLRMAGDQASGNFSGLERTVVMVPEDLDLTALESRFLKAFPTDLLRELPVDQPPRRTEAQAEMLSDAELLGWILHVPDCPAPRWDGTAHIFHAGGESNEVREVLRRGLSEGYRLDEVELLHTDVETYVPLVFETLMRLEPNPQFDSLSLPVTFAEGIPVRYSRPGRALAAWMSWMEHGYPQLTLLRMIQEDLLSVPDSADGTVTSASLAAELRSVRIGMGREHYLTSLQDRANDLQGAASVEPASPQSPEKLHRNRSQDASSGENVRTLKALMSLVSELLELSPPPPADGAELLSCASRFVSELARRTNELDNYAAKAIIERIEEMTFWIGDTAEPSAFGIRDWLLSLPNDLKVGGSGPRPGCIHVAHIDSGGHSGRPHTFVLGLDDARFPGAGLNDPFLLDTERAKLSPDLPKASSQLDRRVERFAGLLTRLRGTVTLSFSSLDLTDDRTLFPCSSLLSAYRILSGNRKGDQTDMMRWLPIPAGFAPTQPEQCLDLTEWWLWRLCGSDAVADAEDVIEGLYPHLGRGRQAAARRNSEEFTEYDGRIPDPPEVLDPFSPSGPVMSTARLEQMGRCPLSYFFKYVLRIKPPDSVEMDLGRWLEAAPFGELLHEIFFRFMRHLITERRRPVYDRDSPVLFKILEEQVQRYRRIYPPPGQSAFQRQLKRLKRAARIFLIEEEELCRRSRPMFLEAAIGVTSEFPQSDLDSDKPVSMVLNPGKSVRVTARIDRIDLADADTNPSFVVWDYKSGSAWKYEKPDELWQGRVVQHALYIALARELLRKKVSPTSEVSRFGYFFPGERTRGLRLMRWKDQAESAKQVIERLCEIAAAGAFLATENYKDDCTFCDFRPICGDVEAVAAAARRKMENPANEILDSIRELRGIGVRTVA